MADNDDRDYLDENGNDLRYGHYSNTVTGRKWRPDPQQILELKKSGKWYKMLDITQRWILADALPIPLNSKSLDGIMANIDRIERFKKKNKEQS